jgi:NAD(P)-dependent dehydrogenase (short-subunit alcohol dehydrogenase family)
MKERFAVDLNGVVAVVTGASRGAGRSIAVVLGEACANVAPSEPLKVNRVFEISLDVKDELEDVFGRSQRWQRFSPG